MTARAIASLAAATALALAPLSSDARIFVVPGCGGERHIAVVPGDPARPDSDRCGKACHAVSERRGKGTGAKRNCC